MESAGTQRSGKHAPRDGTRRRSIESRKGGGAAGPTLHVSSTRDGEAATLAWLFRRPGRQDGSVAAQAVAGRHRERPLSEPQDSEPSGGSG